MLKRSGIEVEALLWYALEQNHEPECTIEESLKYLGRNHLMLDMSCRGLFESASTPMKSFCTLEDQLLTSNKMACRIFDDTRRRTCKVNILQIPHFKAWLNIKESINTVAIGGEVPGPDFQSFKLYANEEMQSNVDAIKIGTIKILPIARINGRAFYVIKEDLKPHLELFKVTMYTDLVVPRPEVNYLFSYI
jgi:hypothetical protein